MKPTETQPYAFFVATRQGGGYRVSALNGTSFACGSQRSATSCQVYDVDLSVLNLSTSDARTLLGQIGRDPSSPTLLFLGAIDGESLAVQEVWRAPAPLPLSGTVLQVSHNPAQALVANTWAPTQVGAIDFTTGPKAQYCVIFIEDAGAQEQRCSLSYVPATTDVTSAAGVLLAGHTGRDGTLHVQQYFLKVSTGYDNDGDGYSYCSAGEAVCSDYSCYVVDGGSCRQGHWGGRGEAPEASTYIRSTSTSVQSWLLSTGQLQPIDLE